MQILPGITGAVAPAAAGAQTTGSASGTSGSSAGAATVTANDFLQLLVAEMKNQDPTANTDPNQYINQLVQVNSLEQLVQINQDLGGGQRPARERADRQPGTPVLRFTDLRSRCRGET